MVFGFMDENAGAGLGLNSSFVLSQQRQQQQHQQQQQQAPAPREFLRDVLGLGGGVQDYFRLEGLRARQQEDHLISCYAQQQQQQQQQHQPDELFFRGTSFHHHLGAAVSANPPPNRRFLESRREEYGESSEEQHRLTISNAAAVAGAACAAADASSSENINAVTTPFVKDHQHHQISSNVEVSSLPLADIISRHHHQAQAQASADAASAEFARQQQQQQQDQLQPQQQPQQPQQQPQQQQHKKVSHEGGVTCKECGNQAKKDCPYQRCRTCCKSRSFDCQTHIKSTWVPAAKRRERQPMPDSSASGDALGAGIDLPRSKRARSSNFQLAGSCTSLTPTSSGGSPRSETAPPFRGCQFPMEVRAQALFKCIKLTTVDDGEDEYAYQVSVRIGGHIFKGVLHDRGVDTTLDTENNVSNTMSNFNFSSNLSSCNSSMNMGNAAAASRMSSLQLGGAARAVPQGAALLDPTVTLYGSLNNPLEEMRHSGGNW